AHLLVRASGWRDPCRHRRTRRADRHNGLSRSRRQRRMSSMTHNADMNLGMTERLKPLHEKVAKMVREEILPLDEEFLAEVNKGERWSYTERQTEILEGLKAKARERGLWNFWLTHSDR